MSVRDRKGYAVALCAAAVAMASCTGGSAFSAPSSSYTAPAAHAESAAAAPSWMAPRASSQDLLYISSYGGAKGGDVYAYTYPQGHLAGTLTGFINPFGECVDRAGDLFVVAYANASYNSSTIYEYAHGGASPIATLSDPSVAVGCSVDPKTGNLAASGDGVAIFKHAAGNPTMYYSSEFGFYYCGYDDQGNLYLSAENGRYGDQAELVRLPSGGGSFQQISLYTRLYTKSLFWPSVQWDGKHIAVTSASAGRGGLQGPIFVYRLRISGTSATVIGTTELTTSRNNYSGQLWIQGSTIIGVGKVRGGYENAFLWPYPRGGKFREAITRIGGERDPQLWGVTVSTAQSS